MEDRWLQKLLIKNGADIEEENISCETPVMTAVRKRKCKVIQFLVECGCDLNKQNNRGDSVLHIGEYGDSGNVVSLLHTYGDTVLDESLKNLENFTALDLATKTLRTL